MKSIEDRLRDLIAYQLGVSSEAVTNGSHLVNDLGADSLDIVQISIEIEDEFDIECDENEIEKGALTFSSMLAFITARLDAAK